METNNFVTEQNVSINDFERVCRTCLATVDLVSICNLLDTRYFPVEIALSKYTQVQFDPLDKLPKQICSNCVKNLKNCYSFLLNCDLVNTSLKECLARHETGVCLPNEIEYVNCQIKQEPTEFNLSELETSENPVMPSQTKIEDFHSVVNIKEEAVNNSEDENDSDNYDADGKEIITNAKHDRRKTLKRKPEVDLDRIRTGKKPYTCKECSKIFNKPSYFKRHMRTHTGERPYACDVCNKAFTQTGFLTRHMITHTGKRPHTCQVCSKAFTQSNDLKNHMRIHTGEKPYLCKTCNKAFTHPSTLKIHTKIHSGERSNTCEVCNKAFTQSSQLKSHMRIHTGEKPYICEVCNKAFTKFDNLKNHMRIHTGEKPYICEICSKAFNISSHFKRHMRTHTGEKPYSCEVCSKAFIQSGPLKRHMITHREMAPQTISLQ